jgi:uncharacterized OB-fold protein
MNDVRTQLRSGRYLPVIYPEEAPFWAAARRGSLVLQRCNRCGHVIYPIGPVCSHCLSDDIEWTPMSGRGHVTSFVVYHRGWTNWLAERVPYAVVQVELEEGPRLTGNPLDLPLAELAVGLEVTVAFERVSREVTLVQFRPVND